MKSVFHAKEFGKIINFKTPEDARVNTIFYLSRYCLLISKPCKLNYSLRQISYVCFLILCFDSFGI